MAIIVSDSLIYVGQADRDSIICEIRCCSRDIVKLIFSPSGRYLAAVGANGGVGIYSALKRSILRSI